MKRLVSLFAFSCFCLFSMAQAVVKFDKSTINFGEFEESKVQTCEFVFTNTGDKPLVIQQAFGSCGCTVATPPKDPIAPGEKGVIKVSYNGKGRYEGTFSKLITVRSNASNSIVRLYIRGNMKTEK